MEDWLVGYRSDASRVTTATSTGRCVCFATNKAIEPFNTELQTKTQSVSLKRLGLIQNQFCKLKVTLFMNTPVEGVSMFPDIRN